MNWSYAAAVCIAFSVTVLATPLVRKMAVLLGAMDRPDGVRKVHAAPTARLGGLAVALGFFAALIAVNLFYPQEATPELRKLLLPSVLILATGAWDDLRSLRPRVKLLFQTVAALAFCLTGFRMEHIIGVTLPLAVSLVVSVAWLVACANAMNLFDGMDGLAPGVGLFASLMVCGLALFEGKESVAILAMCLAGGCAGFLLFNFPPALVFLGDSGSLFIGMLLGVLAIEGSFKSHLTFALAVPVVTLGLPLTDTLLAVIRRLSRRASIFTADKEHIHHRLVASGFTRRQALFLLYGISICLASLSLLVALSNSLVAGLLIIAAGGLIGLLARFAGADFVRDFGIMVLGRIRGTGQPPPVAQGAAGGGAKPQSHLPTAGEEAHREARLSGGDGAPAEGSISQGQQDLRNTVLRVAFLTPLPTPYRQPLLERLVEKAEADVVVYYFAAGEKDRSWKVPIPEDPRFRVLRGKSLAFTGKKSFINHWNPGLFRELDEGRFDLIVVPGYALLSSQAAIAWAWLRKKPYVISSESHLSEPRSWLRRASKKTLVGAVVSRAAACLATGTLSKQYLCHYGARPEDVFFFPNTPDVDWFMERSKVLRPQRAELRKKWAIPEGPTVIYVGRLIQVKGVDILIRAFAGVVEQIPGAQLLIVGDGSEESALRALASSDRLKDSVHFLGFHEREELVELYACADLFCLPSRHEPWGVVVNEAAACGLPLVVSDRVGAGRDLVREGTNGYVVPAENVEQFTLRIAEMLAPTAAMSAWSAASTRLAAEWGYPLALDQFRQMCDHVLKDGGPFDPAQGRSDAARMGGGRAAT